MNLEAVNSALAATVRKQEEELKAADAEIARLKESVAVTGRLFAASRDALAEVNADNERLRAALEEITSLGAQKRGSASYAMAAIARAALGGDND